MGLSIAYRYRLKCGPAEARRRVAQLHDFARSLPFDEVCDVVEHDPPDGRRAFDPPPSDTAWKPGAAYLSRPRDDGRSETVTVPAKHVVSFVARTDGAEDAEFGLASHPPVVVHREDIVTESRPGHESRTLGAGPAVEVPTRRHGWYSWASGCKTQYAAHPDLGGDANFLRAHVSVFRLFDKCRRLGMRGSIRDDADFFHHRDEGALLEELRRWDERMAGYAGRVSDGLAGHGVAVVAPIKSRPDFEHLEARGTRPGAGLIDPTSEGPHHRRET